MPSRNLPVTINKNCLEVELEAKTDKYFLEHGIFSFMVKNADSHNGSTVKWHDVRVFSPFVEVDIAPANKSPIACEIVSEGPRSKDKALKWILMSESLNAPQNNGRHLHGAPDPKGKSGATCWMRFRSAGRESTSHESQFSGTSGRGILKIYFLTLGTEGFDIRLTQSEPSRKVIEIVSRTGGLLGIILHTKDGIYRGSTETKTGVISTQSMSQEPQRITCHNETDTATAYPRYIPYCQSLSNRSQYLTHLDQVLVGQVDLEQTLKGFKVHEPVVLMKSASVIPELDGKSGKYLVSFILATVAFFPKLKTESHLYGSKKRWDGIERLGSCIIFVVVEMQLYFRTKVILATKNDSLV
ncbi:hypothetical protein FB451DRAFT_1164126 [Mycena latifolia]|nr:hypothetical protein FB451DRAFT_1164126 [Mycena latifolia]